VSIFFFFRAKIENSRFTTVKANISSFVFIFLSQTTPLSFYFKSIQLKFFLPMIVFCLAVEPDNPIFAQLSLELHKEVMVSL